tara:strand:+ start:829 stop:1020 length:192 start_codon:yes stop_codon:yes gene_type:complete
VFLLIFVKNLPSVINITKIKNSPTFVREFLLFLDYFLKYYSGNVAPVGNTEKSNTMNSAVLVG